MYLICKNVYVASLKIWNSPSFSVFLRCSETSEPGFQLNFDWGRKVTAALDLTLLGYFSRKEDARNIPTAYLHRKLKRRKFTYSWQSLVPSPLSRTKIHCFEHVQLRNTKTCEKYQFWPELTPYVPFPVSGVWLTSEPITKMMLQDAEGYVFSATFYIYVVMSMYTHRESLFGSPFALSLLLTWFGSLVTNYQCIYE